MSTPTNPERASSTATALGAFRERVGYDDDATSMLDLITDLGHLARIHKLDFVQIAARAISVWDYERRNPNGIGASPQVTVTLQGRRPKYASTAKYVLRQRL